MAKAFTMLTTIKGSLLEGFYPKGWDLRRMDRCCDLNLKQLTTPRPFWNKSFRPVPVTNVAAMDRQMGEAMADEIERTARLGQSLAMILPVGPMGMYKHLVRRLKSSHTSCRHVTTFNMDEWADRSGNTMPGTQPGGFENAMSEALFEPLGKLTVPTPQRNFATKKNLPTYTAKISAIKASGGRLVTVYGIGRVCHIAFWEPQLAAEFPDISDWRKQTHKIGVALHPLTIEQNSLHSFMSRFTQIPAFANSVGPGSFLQSDYCIGGADGVYPERGASWQGMSLCVTLQHGPTPWLPSTFMPTMPGRLFFIRNLAGPLRPEAH